MSKTNNAPERGSSMSRRQIITGAAGVATAGVVATWVHSLWNPPEARTVARPVRTGGLSPSEMTESGPLPELVLGKKDAPVTIVEYADLTCPHCAAFHRDVLPKLKEKYIDTGKVRLLLREFPLNNTSLIAFMAARCPAPEQALPLLSALFVRQDDWRSATSFGELRDKLFGMAQQVGLTRDAFDACVPSMGTDGQVRLTSKQQKLATDIKAVRDRGHKGFGVSSTPTFFINGKRLSGGRLEDFENAIAPLLEKS